LHVVLSLESLREIGIGVFREYLDNMVYLCNGATFC